MAKLGRQVHSASGFRSVTWTPLECFACRRSATFGFRKLYICQECAAVPGITTTKNLDFYERTALAEVVGDAAARFVAEAGTDLSAWSEEQALEFAKVIFLGVGDSIRRQIETGKAPF